LLQSERDAAKAELEQARAQLKELETISKSLAEKTAQIQALQDAAREKEAAQSALRVQVTTL